MTTVPTLTEIKDYLGELAAGKSDATIQTAYDAEKVDQANRCRIPDLVADPNAFPEPLAESLGRRVAHNLAMRGVPLGVQVDELGAVSIGSRDPEVRRLEGPYRRLCVG